MSNNHSGAILVVGATGTTGSRIRASLADAGVRVVAASRRGGDVRFDWHDAATHRDALDGVERMYLIAPPGDPDPEAVTRPFLDLALTSGVRRAVLLSSSLIPCGATGLGRVHAFIAGSFPEWAVLRPSWFMQNFAGRHPRADAIRASGVITSATGTGRVGFIDAGDIAAVAVRALLDETPLNSDVILTGPAALSYDDVAAILGRASGREITHHDVGYERMCEAFEADGLPVEYARFLAGLDALIAEGAEDRVTDGVLRLTGTRPRSFEDFAAEIPWG
jgi:uncharacterized protein YbjT (DUF2867 family)